VADLAEFASTCELLNARRKSSDPIEE